MIFMLEKFSLETVNERLLSIKDTTYRYIIVRKLLKKLRKESGGDKIKKYTSKRHGNKIMRSGIKDSGIKDSGKKDSGIKDSGKKDSIIMNSGIKEAEGNESRPVRCSESDSESGFDPS